MSDKEMEVDTPTGNTMKDVAILEVDSLEI